MSYRLLLASLAVSLSVASCATKPPGPEASLKTAYAATPAETKALKANDPVSMEPSKWGRRRLPV